ncbi:uncharacterized protein PHALS_05143 [Plasmopara halstedii]|nr:uncharacterized protein PHALS_00076 [Plasmopara halstedii]XP_024584178.1 uncharacterized protein PHALS_05143 [Plasmopara halstedii]CEG35741.1 hypothetical protein PHALS_00076 [Plasmopara halstedii]CEG47809.1 hypothetical protein PHALS_05143 [Plasmopara halstedii]|eukprot:XP_024572110.1 hypothetical protein PHALS_00076 [Plasmopara halstedii]
MGSDATSVAKPRKNITPPERAEVIAFLLRVSIELRPPPGAIGSSATKYGCSTDQISRLWRRTTKDIKAGEPINYNSGRKGKSGRKTRLTPEFRHALNDAIELIPLEDRSDIRTLANTLGIPKSTLHDYFLAGVFRCHTARAKPMLTDKQRIDRVKFAASFVQRGPGVCIRFDSMMEYVHLDEKWFYLKKDKQRFYLGEHEEEPYITVKNKNYMIKVMFLAAVARPRWSAKNHCIWDGKIGVWPFAVYEPAERSSKNRAAGTLELKTYTVDRDIYRQALCRMVIPRIKAVWPSGKRVVLQQDNAKPHVTVDDPEVHSACSAGGWDMKLTAQPANSPDFNANDLGFFASLQSLQHKMKAKTIEDLVNNVDDAFAKLHYTALDKVFLTLQSVLQETMHIDGCNKYKIPHLAKDTLRTSTGLLPPSLTCSDRVYDKARRFLSSVGQK